MDEEGREGTAVGSKQELAQKFFENFSTPELLKCWNEPADVNMWHPIHRIGIITDFKWTEKLSGNSFFFGGGG